MGRAILWGLAVTFVLGVGVWAFSESVLPPIGNWLDASNPRFPSTHVLALPGGNNTRVFAAAALINHGLCQQAVVIENEAAPDVTAGDALPSHEIARRVLVKRGVHAENIRLIRGSSNSTKTDAIIARQIWRETPNATLMVVTNKFHVRRAKLAFRSQLSEELFARVSFIGTPDDRFSLDSWWRTEAGFQTVTSEYLKLIFYAVREARNTVLAATLLIAAVLAGVWRQWASRHKRTTTAEGLS